MPLKAPILARQIKLGGCPAKWADNLECLEIFGVPSQYTFSNYNNLRFEFLSNIPNGPFFRHLPRTLYAMVGLTHTAPREVPVLSPGPKSLRPLVC